MVSPLGESDLSPETLNWLVEPSNPSARYLALTRVLVRPERDGQVLASRADIPHAGPARAILQAQYPQGYWMRPGIGYSPRYRATVWQIIFLAQLGMGRVEPVDRAVGHLLASNQREDGAFRARKGPGETPVALNGSLLWALETLGYGGQPEVQRAWSWLAQRVDDHGFGDTGGGGRRSSPHGAVKVLWAANAVPEDRREGAVTSLGEAAVASLLATPPDALREDPRWEQLTFPLADGADALQWLAVLVEAGCRDDCRLDQARSWLTRKRLLDGRWPLEHVPGKLWADFGEIGGPNKWVTLRALRVGR